MSLLLAAPNMQAQDNESVSLDESFAPPISLNPAQEKKDKEGKKKEKKEKTPKGVFYGIPTRKVILKHQKGRYTTIQKFYILRNYEHPSKYVLEKFYFDPSQKGNKRKVAQQRVASERYGMPLHGPYEKRVNGEVVESGIYYVGTKHGRWMKYYTGNRLVDKMKYDKGYPKHSKISYYGNSKTKIKEVIPIQHGEKKGQYLEFYPSGRLKVMGEYDNDRKVGQWHEFYDTNLRLRKQIVQYTKDPFEEKEPYVYKAWNKRGKEITDNSGK